MTNPSFFYFNEKQLGLSYTNQPSGILDVTRLIQNKKPFKNSTLVSVQKPKTLILADWTAECWSDDKIRNVQKVLSGLLDDGFPVYLWQNRLQPCSNNVLKRMDESWHDDLPDDRLLQGEICPLTKEELFTRFSCKLTEITPASSNGIRQIAVAQCCLSADKILILDDYWINTLLSGKQVLQTRQLYMSEINRTEEKKRLHLGLLSIDESTSSFEEIVYDAFPPANIEIVIPERLMQLPRILQFSQLKLNKALADELLVNNSLTRRKMTFNLDDLHHIKVLNIIEDIGINQLQKLLANTPQLKKLDLIIPKDCSQEVILELGSVETLNIRSSTLNMSVLSHATNLKSLHLEHSTILADKFNRIVTLEDLEDLMIINSVISAADLHGLLNPNLLRLSLDNYNLLAKMTEPLNLSNLIELNIYNTINATDMNRLLLSTRHLQLLAILEGSEIKGDLPSHMNLSHLEFLHVDNCNTSIENIQNLLLSTKKIKELYLNKYANFPNHFIENLHLEYLTRLGFNDSDITTPALTTWLKKGINLKQLSIGYCDETLHLDSTLKELMKGIILELGDADEYDDRFLNPDQHDDNPTHEVKPRTVNASTTLDADTSCPSIKEIEVLRIFSPLGHHPMPAIRDYRLQAFNKVQITTSPCDLTDAFTLYNEERLLSKCSQPMQIDNIQAMGKGLAQTTTNGLYYLGQQKLMLTPEWQALPSLSAMEELTHFTVDSGPGVIEFSWSERDNLYYLRSATVGWRELSFLLKVSQTTRDVPLPDEVDEMLHYCSQFDAGALVIDQAHPTGEEYFNSLIAQKKGACRHRALAFKVLMERNHPEFPVRIIINQCHAFVEIKVDKQWINYDLGGYPAKLNVKEPLTHHDAPQEQLPTAHYEKQLQTWKKKTPYTQTMLGYCHYITQPGEAKKRLVELTHSDAVYNVQLQLQSWCKKTSRPFFYINSPDDLVCSAPFLKRIGNRGILTPGPGGPLCDFLQKNNAPHNPGILIINYDNFAADDLVRCNSLLDKERLADGVPLPPDLLIIGLINTKKSDCYQGADFYSRFDRRESYPQDLSWSEDPILLPLSEKTPQLKTISINLYHAPDWEERLLGHWIIQKDSLYFMEGALQKAFHSAPPVEPHAMPLFTMDELQRALGRDFPLELQNAPWEDKKFMLFWQQACLLGKIEHAGRVIHLPESLQLIHSNGYDWEQLTTQVTWHVGLAPQENTFVLNACYINDFFTRYHCNNETNLLDTLVGVIQTHAHETIQVNLTGVLSEDKWAMFLSACQEHCVHLNVYCAPGITLPTVFGVTLPLIPREVLEWAGTGLSHTTVLMSSDCDTTTQQLTLHDNLWQVIESSECEGDDLLIHIHADVDERNGIMRFTQKPQALLLALEQGQKVLLKGRFSPELVDALAPFLLARQHNHHPRGQLVLLSEHDAFNYLPVQRHSVTRQEKLDCLVHLFSAMEVQNLDEELLDNESLSQLGARLSYWSAMQTDNAWQGMHGLSSGVVLHEFNAQKSAQIADEFNQQRLDAVNQILAKSPYVFLTGLTAVGKSTFVEKNFSTAHDVLYIGEACLADWAKDASDTRKILFIDEANLSEREWSEFEGLFNNPPGMLIEGHYYPLTGQHRVLFAGNPVNYGDERKLAPFFSRHGNALVFAPMPLEFIYEVILKPVFAHSELAADTLKLATPLLNIYKFLCECSTDKILISPRELQMMALLTVSYQQQQPEHHAIQVAEYYAWCLAQALVPEPHRAALDQHFKPLSEWRRLEVHTVPQEFLVTPSRQYIGHHLNDFLALRQFKRNHALNEEQRYGGLGGLVIEGEPGIGKSELVITTLVAQGYHEMHAARHLPEKPFYRMPVSMPMDEKKNLLLKAFHQGAVVIIDEINSAPMMERLLNDLLMGKTPDGKRPDKPGFLIIGTQNPITMDGRRAPSTALARRLMTVTLPAYTTEEMKAILGSKGLDQDTASLMVSAYELNVSKAHKKNLSPLPTFRDLLKLAEREIKAKNAFTFAHQEIDEDREQLLKRKNHFSQPAEKKVKLTQEINKDRGRLLTRQGFFAQPTEEDMLDEKDVIPVWKRH